MRVHMWTSTPSLWQQDEALDGLAEEPHPAGAGREDEGLVLLFWRPERGGVGHGLC